MLHDRWFSACEVAQRPVADPRVLEFHARQLGAAELAARPLEVRAVRFGAARDLSRVAYPPAVLLEALPILRIFVSQVQRELERLARVTGELQEPKEGHALRVFSQHGLPVLRDRKSVV